MNRLIHKGLITTIIGLTIIVFTGILIYTEKASIEASAGWIALSLMFLRSKDTLINLEDKEK